MIMDSSTNCAGCYWRDGCDHSPPCDFYCSPDMEYDDAYIEHCIEEERTQFRAEWFEYIEDFE